MSAYYLKGVAPPHVRLMQIFRGAFPFLAMVLVAIVLLYIFPGIALYLPQAIYG
jgi:TRAP-type mannitol/chloroaromatic compound transport system permease large subunit